MRLQAKDYRDGQRPVEESASSTTSTYLMSRRREQNLSSSWMTGGGCDSSSCNNSSCSSGGSSCSSSSSSSSSTNSCQSIILWCNLFLRRLWGQERQYIVTHLILPLSTVLLIVHVVLVSSGESDGLLWATAVTTSGRSGGGGSSSSSSSSRLRGGNGVNPNLRVMGLPPSSKELRQLNDELSQMSAHDILRWAHGTFPKYGQLTQVSSFGPSGMVILHMLETLGLLKDVPVVTIDTLHLFPETYDFIHRLEDENDDLKLHTYRPKGYNSQEEFDEALGKDLWKTNVEQYSYWSKVEPTLRALEELRTTAWMTGRRRSQGGERTNLPVIEIDNGNDRRLKINPLAFWTYTDVWDYIRKHDVPYNPLHDRGYKSIGDYMSTAPVDETADERSGRFIGLGTTECGIHSTRKKIKRMRQEAELAGRQFDQATLPCPGCLEVTPTTFDDVILRGQVLPPDSSVNNANENANENENANALPPKDILIEFYSPLCGGCQEFAPKFHQLAERLVGNVPELQVARFDITDHDVPQSGQDIGLVVEVTPTMYLVKHRTTNNNNNNNNGQHPVIEFYDLFNGSQHPSDILDWLQSQTDYDVMHTNGEDKMS